MRYIENRGLHGLAANANTAENPTMAVTHTQGYLIQPNSQIM